FISSHICSFKQLKMSKKSFVLRINPETLKLLDKWAADEFRSLNGQIEFLLQKALMEAKRWKVSSQNDRTSSDEADEIKK
ncbi:MAG TPA: hypothetical protein PLO39_12600, partial [Saprospiraceae bacterium]|nr:hypothetical protein [Saprospiraceae bacterium]